MFRLDHTPPLSSDWRDLGPFTDYSDGRTTAEIVQAWIDTHLFDPATHNSELLCDAYEAALNDLLDREDVRLHCGHMWTTRGTYHTERGRFHDDIVTPMIRDAIARIDIALLLPEAMKVPRELRGHRLEWIPELRMARCSECRGALNHEIRLDGTDWCPRS